jgi:phosphotransferase system IIB component
MTGIVAQIVAGFGGICNIASTEHETTRAASKYRHNRLTATP